MAKGLMNNIELIDSLITDLNAGIKQVVSGDYISWSAINLKMFQKLNNLKKGVSADMQNREKIIEDLKHQLREKGVEVIDIPIEQFKGGDANGNI